MASKDKAFAIIIVIGLLTASLFSSSRATKEEVVPYPEAMTGKNAPEFSLQGLYGERIDLSNLKGSPTVLIFGTSW